MIYLYYMLIHFCSLEEKKDTILIIVVIEQTEQMINITLLLTLDKEANKHIF